MKTKNKKLKVSAILMNAPASWPSVSIIQPEFFKLLKSKFSNFKKVDILQALPKNAVKDDFWIFPSGSVQVSTLQWLKVNFKNPTNRPPAIFYWGGEGAKLGYHILRFKDVFGPNDQWVVSCKAEKKLLDFWFPENNRTHVMFLPVAKSFKPLNDLTLKKDLRQKLQLPSRKKLMLYAGRISQQKNLVPLLELLEKYQDISLVVCGDVDSVGVPHLASAGMEHIPSRLAEQIGQRNLSTRIKFFPFQSQIELCKIMQVCDYQVSLSAHYGEDFGYSIAQGLHCGLKSVLSNWGGHRNWQGFKACAHSISFVELSWREGAIVGKPNLKASIDLPILNPKKDFNHFYQVTVEDQLQEIIDQVLNENNKTKVRQSNIQVLPNLINFWKQADKKPRQQMFSGPEDPFFTTVVKLYSGY